MQVKRIPKGYMIRIDQGEELFQALEVFVEEHHIQAGYVTAIGMAREVELGFFDTEQAEYERKTFSESLEVVSLSGTISEYEDRPFYHLHGVFGRKDFSTVGGHIMKLVTDMTLEVYVNDFETQLDRAAEEVTGLKLLQF